MNSNKLYKYSKDRPYCKKTPITYCFTKTIFTKSDINQLLLNISVIEKQKTES